MYTNLSAHSAAAMIMFARAVASAASRNVLLAGSLNRTLTPSTAATLSTSAKRTGTRFVEDFSINSNYSYMHLYELTHKSNLDHHFSENQGENTRERHSGLKHPLLTVVGVGVFLGTSVTVIKKMQADSKIGNKDFALNDPYQKLPVVTKTIKKDEEHKKV